MGRRRGGVLRDLPAKLFLCDEPFPLGASSEAEKSNRYSCGSSSAPRLLPTVSPISTTRRRLAEHWAGLSRNGCPCAIGREAGPARRFRLAGPGTRSFRVNRATMSITPGPPTSLTVHLTTSLLESSSLPLNCCKDVARKPHASNSGREHRLPWPIICT